MFITSDPCSRIIALFFNKLTNPQTISNFPALNNSIGSQLYKTAIIIIIKYYLQSLILTL